jgi:hypothetical protein
VVIYSLLTKENENKKVNQSSSLSLVLAQIKDDLKAVVAGLDQRAHPRRKLRFDERPALLMGR